MKTNIKIIFLNVSGQLNLLDFKDLSFNGLQITHSRADAWEGEWIRVFFDDGSFKTCRKQDQANFILQDNQEISIPCQ